MADPKFPPIVPLIVGAAGVAAAFAVPAQPIVAGAIGLIAGFLGWMLGSDFQALQSSAERSQGKLNEAETELKALRAAGPASPEQAARLEKELEQARSQVTSLRDERDEARSQARDAADGKTRAERKAGELEEQLAELRRARDGAKANEAAAQEQLAAAKRDAASARDEVEAAKRSAAAARDEVEAAKRAEAAAKVELERSRNAREEAKSELEDALASLERAQRDLEESRRAVAELESMSAGGGGGGDGMAESQVRELHSRIAELEQELETARAKSGPDTLIPHGPERMVTELGEALATIDGILSAMTEMNSGLKGISESVELLASNAEESSSSILEMAAANDEVAESMFNLAASVQETATSIEEMTFSVKEVAKNIEALSTTAEETSSAMNQMDISIQQVENNANETAQLSEEVVWAAEGGVDAINQTIEVINMIKNSAADAVSVISRLGGRIDEIGKILSVIDDVSEQTNLLALNAAIIAAQAGEHGKGFAVVAD